MPAESSQSASPGVAKGYSLDFHSVLRYVVTKLDESPATTFSLVTRYHHLVVTDLGRVRHHEHLANDAEAKRFLIDRAILALGNQISTNAEGVHTLAVPFEDLRYRDQPFARMQSGATRWGDPFHPMSGRFTVSLRSRSTDAGDAELRESLRAFGWLKELPAIVDERGSVIDGKRRIAIATELGIEPVTVTYTFGRGDAADEQRLRLMLALNVGHRAFTEADRKRIARYLYNADEWDLARMGSVLPPSPNGSQPVVAAAAVVSEEFDPADVDNWNKIVAHIAACGAAGATVHEMMPVFGLKGDTDRRWLARQLERLLHQRRVRHQGKRGGRDVWTVPGIEQHAESDPSADGTYVEVTHPPLPSFASTYRQIVPASERWGTEEQLRAADKLALDLRMEVDAAAELVYPNDQAIADRIVQVYGLPQAMPANTAYSMYMRAAKLLGIKLTPQHRRTRKPTARA